MTEKLNIAYSNNDFFYTFVDKDIMPTDTQCDTTFSYKLIPDASCVMNDVSWNDLSLNCFKKELCKNKQKSIEIANLQNNHLGSDQNYLDTKNIYMNEYVKVFNLSIGIILLLLGSFYMQ